MAETTWKKAFHLNFYVSHSNLPNPPNHSYNLAFTAKYTQNKTLSLLFWSCHYFCAILNMFHRTWHSGRRIVWWSC